MKYRQCVLTMCVALCMALSGASAKDKAAHVFLIGLDGWGSYSVEKADMPNVKSLMADGAYTLQKRTVLPSSSAPNWASMFMGAGTELHGYAEWGSQKPDMPSRVVLKNNIFPTVFQIVRDARPDAEIGCIYEWDGIKYLVDTLSMNYHAQVPEASAHPERTSKMAADYIKSKKPTLAAFIFDNPDHVGHAAGHDTPEYYEVLTELDGYIGEIIAAIKDAGIYDDSIIIVTSDHGGIGTGHGGRTMAEMETPFIIAGKNVRNTGEFGESMMQFDCAPTIAYIFGLEGPQVWIGRPMKQVFK